MSFYKELERRSVSVPKTIIFPESDDPRILKAVKTILRNRSAKVILIQKEKAKEIPIKPDRNLTIIDQSFSSQFLDEYHFIRLKKSRITEELIQKRRSGIRLHFPVCC